LFCKPGALLVIKDQGSPRRSFGQAQDMLACCQTIGAAFIEPQNPVEHDLQRYPGNLRRSTPTPTVKDQSHSQQPTDLTCITTSSRRPTQIQ